VLTFHSSEDYLIEFTKPARHCGNDFLYCSDANSLAAWIYAALPRLLTHHRSLSQTLRVSDAKEQRRPATIFTTRDGSAASLSAMARAELLACMAVPVRSSRRD